MPSSSHSSWLAAPTAHACTTGDPVEQPLALRLGEQLGVAHPVDPAVPGQHGRADHERSGPRAPPDLVHADDDLVARGPQLPLDDRVGACFFDDRGAGAAPSHAADR